MASKTEPGDASGAASRKVAKPPVFDPSREAAQLPAFDVQAPASLQRELEPEIAKGIDLSGRAKIVMAAGRGKTGKTTLLRWIAEQSLEDSRTFLMADIDPTNASFAAYFEGVSRPRDDDPLHVRDWLQRFIEYAVAHGYSALIDLGGGDTTLRSIAAEMPGFDTMIEEAGLAVAIFYLVGPHPEDLTPIATLSERGFNPPARAIVLNDGTAPIGRSRPEAFARVMSTALFKAAVEGGAIPLWMPRLHAAEAIEARHCGFREGRDGKTEPALGLFDRTRVRAWLDVMDKRFVGVRSWLP
jgi:hypothetical protein